MGVDAGFPVHFRISSCPMIHVRLGITAPPSIPILALQGVRYGCPSQVFHDGIEARFAAHRLIRKCRAAA